MSFSKYQVKNRFLSPDLLKTQESVCSNTLFLNTFQQHNTVNVTNGVWRNNNSDIMSGYRLDQSIEVSMLTS